MNKIWNDKNIKPIKKIQSIPQFHFYWVFNFRHKKTPKKKKKKKKNEKKKKQFL